MRRITLAMLFVALLTASCGLKINMPTLSSVDSQNVVTMAVQESAR